MLQLTSVTVLSGQTTSDSCDSGINQVVGVVFPSAGISATSFELLVSFDDVVFHELSDILGATAVIPVGNYVYFPPELSYALPRFVKVKLSGTELTDTLIQIVTREI